MYLFIICVLLVPIMVSYVVIVLLLLLLVCRREDIMKKLGAPGSAIRPEGRAPRVVPCILFII